MEPTSKACRKCGVEKLASEFFRDSGKACGRRHACKACESPPKKDKPSAYERFVLGTGWKHLT